MLKINDYVTHASKYNPPVYRVIKLVGDDRAEVEYVGEYVGGRLQHFSTYRQRTIRKVSDLQPYN